MKLRIADLTTSVLRIGLQQYLDLKIRKEDFNNKLSSHLMLKIITTCSENYIHFIFIPIYLTHSSQPLDVFFLPSQKGHGIIFGKMEKWPRK